MCLILGLYRFCIYKLLSAFCGYCVVKITVILLPPRRTETSRKQRRRETSSESRKPHTLYRFRSSHTSLKGVGLSLYMKHKRIIYIDPKLAQDASGSKESLDALALVLSIKLTFVDSCVRDATAVKVMRTFGIGHTRYKRAVEYAQRKGWLIRKGETLTAAKIKTAGVYNIRLVFTKHFYKGKRTKSDIIKAAYTLTQMCNFIRQAVILFHISKQAVVYDTITMATHPSKRTSQQAHKQAMKRAERWGMCKPKLRRKADRLSFARMAELASCSKSKAKSLVKSLIDDKVIDRHENYECTKYHIDEYCKAMRDDYARLGKRGSLVRYDGRVMLRLANSYTLNKQVVNFVRDYNPKQRGTA